MRAAAPVPGIVAECAGDAGGPDDLGPLPDLLQELDDQLSFQQQQRRRARDALFARRIDRLPFERYSVAERAAAAATGLAGGGYDGVLRDIRINAPPTAASGTARGSVRPLPVPVVETVDLARVLRSLDPAADVDIFPTIEAFTSYDVFKDVVLGKAYVPELHRRVTCPVARLRQLRKLRYVQRLRRALPDAFTCHLFWVLKSDGVSERTIFNGVPWNERVLPPHPTRVCALHDMLTDLTADRVQSYLTFDFSTWFVQLRTDPRVAGTWCVRFRDGSLWRMSGVPMGISWAPALAQATSLALVRVFMRGLPECLRRVVHCAHVYIDNIIFALTSRTEEQEIAKRWRDFCATMGAVLKEADTQIGPSVDWLGVVVHAGADRELKLREAFVSKIDEAARLLDAAPSQTVRYWWRLVALGVYGRWVRQDGLSDMITCLRWLQRLSADISVGTINWGTQVTPWAGVVDALRGVYASLPTSWRLWAPPDQVLVVGESDAATSGFLACTYICDTTLYILRLRRADERHINILEFHALAAGLRRAAQPHRNGRVVWRCDNTTAVAWFRRLWSSDWETNTIIDALRRLQRLLNIGFDVSHMPGAECTADYITRCLYSDACRAPVAWYATRPVSCDCVQTPRFCTHVRDAVRSACMRQCAGCVSPAH